MLGGVIKTGCIPQKRMMHTSPLPSSLFPSTHRHLFYKVCTLLLVLLLIIYSHCLLIWAGWGLLASSCAETVFFLKKLFLVVELVYPFLLFHKKKTKFLRIFSASAIHYAVVDCVIVDLLTFLKKEKQIYILDSISPKPLLQTFREIFVRFVGRFNSDKREVIEVQPYVQKYFCSPMPINILTLCKLGFLQSSTV